MDARAKLRTTRGKINLNVLLIRSNQAYHSRTQSAATQAAKLPELLKTTQISSPTTIQNKNTTLTCCFPVKLSLQKPFINWVIAFFDWVGSLYSWTSKPFVGPWTDSVIAVHILLSCSFKSRLEASAAEETHLSNSCTRAENSANALFSTGADSTVRAAAAASVITRSES